VASEDHLEILGQGVDRWNTWRSANPRIKPDLGEADLSGRDLTGIDLRGVHLAQANLNSSTLHGADLSQSFLFRANLGEADLTRTKIQKANLSQADLSGTDLSGADLSESFLIRANLSGAHLDGADLKNAYLGHASLFRARLVGADLGGASLFKADLGEADFTDSSFEGANLQEALLFRTILKKCRIERANLCYVTMIQADLDQATLKGCSVYGISAWDVSLRGTSQQDLDITPAEKSVISVDNLGVAQMVCLLLHNEEVRREIEHLSLYTVLILGRFGEERRGVLDSLKAALRRKNYSPVAVDFQNAALPNMAETVKTLARMSRFVIADMTDEKRIPQVLDSVVHYLPTIPIQPILEEGQDEHEDYGHYKKFRWVLDLVRFRDAGDLAKRAEATLIRPAEQRAIAFRKAPPEI
jgi:uncharacterized protein YjbI with pentapeptide repeats